MEKWVDIKGYEGLYQVSDLGRVKTVKRSVRNNKHGGTRTVKEAILHPTDNGNGYKIVFLSRGDCRKNFYIHRLVAEHFLENPYNKKCVNHLDYDTSNNIVANLEWCTQKENVQHSIENMKHPREKCKPSNTNEKYISKYLSHGKYECYRLQIKWLGVRKQFKTLKEAVVCRNQILRGGD